MSNIQFQSVQICDPKSPFHGKTVDVEVAAGKIVQVVEAGQGNAKGEVVKGGFLSPGWIDFRVHLTDPGLEWKEDLNSLAQAARAGGFCRIVTLPNTEPVLDNSGAIQALAMRAANLPVKLLPTGALSQKGEGKDLAELFDMGKAGAVGFTDGVQGIHSSGLLLRALQYLKPMGGLVMDAPLEEGLAKGAMIGEGPTSTRMGLKGIPQLAERMAVDRDLQLLGYFPGKLHLGPLTTEAAIEQLATLKAEHPGLSLETSALYLLLDETELEGFDPNFKVWPPLRNSDSVRALRKAVADGLIDVVSSSHHPQSIEEKKHDFVTAQAGAATIEVAFSAAWTGLAESGVSLDRLLDALTYGPAEVLSLDLPGIREGVEAELTWFDPTQSWTPEVASLRSRSKNNPLVGRSLTGKVLGTYACGQFDRT